MKGKAGKWLQCGVIIGVILLVVFVMKWGGGRFGTGVLQKYSITYTDAFDTVTQIMGYAKTEEEFLDTVHCIHEKMLEYHSYFDIYNEYPGINNLKTVNDHAGMGPVSVNQEIMDLLVLGKEIYSKTDGQVNIAMGSVLRIWHNCREEASLSPESAKVPTRDELDDAAQHMNMDMLILDEENLTVELADEEMSLDVGSLAKGYAADLLKEYAKELGVEHMLISLGGNIITIGVKPDDSPWQIGVQNPLYTGESFSEAQYITSAEILNQAAVTSGNYQRYYVVDGVSYCHIIDPDTLMPGSHFASVTIIGPESAMADALSTALFNMSLEEGRTLIESMDDWNAIWITLEGDVIYTDGFDK